LDSGYVFTGKVADEPFCDLKRQFEKATSRAKLKDVTFHTLRHHADSVIMPTLNRASFAEQRLPL